MRKLLLSSFLLICAFVGSAQNDITTVKSEGEDTLTNYLSNLDSLMELWYMKQATLCKYAERPSDTLTVVPEYTDSIYMDRIAKMNTVIDLSYNHRVRAFINLYTKKKRGQVEKMLALSEYYFPMFEEILDYHGVPQELKYLAIIESALNPRARSRVGAVGLWQFMYTTGRMYDLEVNSFVDQRNDPIAETHAAARFLKDLNEMFDDWVLALAAYNCGPGNVRKAIRRSGGKKNYWDIYNYLPRETRGYVPAFIAASYTFEHHEEHNLYPIYQHYPFASDTVMIKEKLHLKQVAEVLNIPIKQVRDLNPQYKIDIIPERKEGYALILPTKYAGMFIGLQDSIFAYKDSIYFNPQNIVKAPPAYNKYTPSAPKGKNKLYYTVRSGDNLGYIAQKYHCKVSDLRYWNNIRGNMIKIGQKLVVYVPKGQTANYKATASTKSTPTKKIKGGYDTYTVRNGDTLWSIARKYPGISQDDIMAWNGIKDARSLKVGMTLKIQRK